MVKRAQKLTVSASSCQSARQRLPDALKAKFGSIGFVKWTCAYSPVLIVDPMQMVLSKSIPEGIYHAWLYQVYLNSSGSRENYDESDDERDSNTETPLESLPILIFWFGTQYEFSIVRLSHLIDWKEGVRKGYKKFPEFMNDRIQILYRPVPSVYALLEDALTRAEEALKRPRENRSLSIVASNSSKRHPAVLNEWHALAMEDPPHLQSFLEKKQRLMPELPHSEWFGQLAFLPKQCAQHCYHHPVLVLDPFRAPPKRRTEWFHKCSSGKLVMVYWLGAYTSGRTQKSVYTYHKLKDLIPLEEGVKLGYDQLSQTILQDYENKKLSSKRLAVIDWWVCGTQWELPRALERQPKDRWGGLEDFEEDHDDDFEYYWECLHSAKEERNRLKKAGPGAVAKSNETSTDEDTIVIASSSSSGYRSKPSRVSPRLSPEQLQEESPRLPLGFRKGQTRALPRKRSPSKQTSSGLSSVSSSDEKKTSSETTVNNGPQKKMQESSLETETMEDQKQPAKSSATAIDGTNASIVDRIKDDSLGNSHTPLKLQRRLNVPLREEEADVSSSAALQLPVVATLAAESPTDSDTALHDAVQDSLLGCAAYLQEESQKATERRVKRKAERALMSPPTSRNGANAPDRIVQLKKRKAATQKKALGVIKRLKKDDAGD
jgi:hypothetical protein